jgi:outer membrane protein assembly factor BamE (lipoprotein component of BamABCDE complex)
MARRQTDQPIPAERVAKVEKGMTKNQVTDILGAPQEIIFSNKEHDPLREHAYVYQYSVEVGTAIFFGAVNFGNLDQKRDRAIVFFGEDGKVANVAQSLRAADAHYGFPFGR